MRTYFIFNQFEEGLKFGHVDYEASHLDEKYINDSGTSDVEQDELNELQEKAVWAPSLSAWVEEIAEFGAKSSEYKIITVGFFP